MRIAIVKLSALGDIVHAMVALQFIKAYDNTAIIDWIVEERFAGILHHNPDISTILTVNLKGLKHNKLAVIQEIRKVRHYALNQYDYVIDAQGLLKSAITARLLGRRVAGFDADSIRETAASWFYHDKISSAYDSNTIDRNALVLSKPLGFEITPEQIRHKMPFLYAGSNAKPFKEYFSTSQKNVVFVIGSTWESRNYPVEKFTKIAQAIQANCLVLWGNQQEKVKAEWMAGQCGTITVLPKVDLNDLKTIIAKSDLVVGNDTGPTHMAWALNKPSITLFGPTPVSRVYQTGINKVIKSRSLVDPYKLNKQDFSIRDIDEQEIIMLATHLLTNTIN